jgi:hypothetical protein
MFCAAIFFGGDFIGFGLFQNLLPRINRATGPIG